MESQPKFIEKSIMGHREENGLDLEEGGQNSALLEPVHEDGAASKTSAKKDDRIIKPVGGTLVESFDLLNTIKRRYIHQRAIYTWCGIALVAVNPYQEQDIYGEQAVETYHSASHSVYLQLDPHIYAVTEDAYSKLERNLRDQSIIVSGESGAGKTVSAKHAMRYLASIASSKAKLRVENRVLASNPIMEAIGNASTVRNDNSSRFGKYIQIYFDRCQRKILGGNMRTYLLEKSRVTKQQMGERNFHIFYQLLNYAQENVESMKYLKLTGNTQDGAKMKFNFLGGIEPHKSRDSLARFNEALKTLNIDDKRADIIYRVIAGILHGGNIQFESAKGGETESELDAPSEVDPLEFHFQTCCELLGLDPSETRKRLTTKLLRTGAREVIEQPLNKCRAEYGRDAMLKYIYECLFIWLVGLINLALGSKDISTATADSAVSSAGACGGEPVSRQTGAPTLATPQLLKSPSSKTKTILDGQQVTAQPLPPHFIGVLDIYGFENFSTNSFEQFCINYANEVLQQQYNQHVFKLEQEEYIREGIDWTFIEYSDNQPVIDLIESKPIGILDLLDEECRMPKGTDRTWCAKLYDQLLPMAQVPRRSSALDDTGGAVFKRPRIDYQNSFIISHYAEEVNYQVESFLEKNRDTIAEEQYELLRASPLLNCIFEEPLLGQQARPAKKRTNKSATVGHQFRGSLAALMRILNATEPHYIRCIKPNDEQKAFEFNEERAVMQLKACGVYETIRISNNGFPSRWLYRDFAKRYCVLIFGTPIYRELLLQLSMASSTASPSSDENNNSSGNYNSDEEDADDRQMQRQLQLSRFMSHLASADVRPICEAICRIAYREPTYQQLRTKEEQSYLDRLLEQHGAKSGAIYQFGKNKIFFRAGQVGYLERIRSQRLRDYAITVQRHVRGLLARRLAARRREEKRRLEEQLLAEQLRREASLQSLHSQTQVSLTGSEHEPTTASTKEPGELERAPEVSLQTETVNRFNSVYNLAVSMMYSTVQPLVIGAVLDYEALDTPDPFLSPIGGSHSRSQTPNEQPMDDLIKELDNFHDLIRKNSVPLDIAVQAFKSLFHLICAHALNQLLIRRDLCQFAKAMQINFNLSCLIQWCREHFPVHWREIVEQLDPIVQATKLLQTRKSSEDIATIEEVCNKLRPAQIIKILNMYTSSYEEQITIDFIHELEDYLTKNRQVSAVGEGFFT